MRFAFFGTGTIAAGVLSELEKAGILPALIVTSPDRPAGRGKTLTPSPVKEWTLARGIETRQPEKLDAEFCDTLRDAGFELFVVADYGAFLPRKLLDIPPQGTLNMHPSLLPKLRGPSPVRSAILTDERQTGVSIMLVDEKMDHGPVLVQRPIAIPEWPPRGRELDALLSSEGGKLLAETMPRWVNSEIQAQEQNHDAATFSKLFKKEDGLLDLVNGDPYQNLLKIRAFDGWPGTYAFFERGGAQIRVSILDAHMEGAKLILDMVKPEGKGAMSATDFLRSGAKPIS